MASSRRLLIIGFLFGILIFLLSLFDYISNPCFFVPAAFVKPTVFRFNSLQGSLEQDDPRLLALLRTRYLVPPANKSSHLKLIGNGHISNKIRKSPVAKLVQKLLGNKSNGFFLECGALDGVYLSNTLELERDFGWMGVLVEADPKYHSSLIATNRKAWVAPVCLSPKPFPMHLKMRRHQIPGHSTIVKYHPDRENILGTEKTQWQEFEVQCFPFYTVLLAALNLTEIDYLSLDVEGAEWSIIQTIPFDKVKIKVIGIEFKASVIHQEAKNYLESLGYKYLGLFKGYALEDGVFAHASILKQAN